MSGNTGKRRVKYEGLVSNKNATADHYYANEFRNNNNRTEQARRGDN